MRPRVVISILLAALIAMGVAVALSKLGASRGTRAPMDDETNAPALSAAGQPAPRTPSGGDSALGLPTATNAAATPSAADADHDKYVQKRIAELSDLAMKDDATSRDTIVSELHNPDKAIRAGALEAIVQFGDRSIVPQLRELAAQTEDAGEKAALIDAADYLNLPSLSEYLAGQRANTNSTATATNGSIRDPHKRR